MTETVESFQVRDGPRLITFTGELLATVSSRRHAVPRWTDLTLYATSGGTYVLEVVGYSVVCHMPGCRTIGSLPRFQEMHPGEDPDNGGFDMCQCVPDGYDFTQLLAEEYRYSASFSEDPNEIVRQLSRDDRGGRSKLPTLSVSLLTQVVDVRPEFGTGWSHVHLE